MFRGLWRESLREMRVCVLGEMVEVWRKMVVKNVKWRKKMIVVVMRKGVERFGFFVERDSFFGL